MNHQIINKTINISTLNRKRKVSIFLPYDYNDTANNYPVMYMHDGQNLFYDNMSYSKHSWGVTRKFNNKDQKQLIIVGIDNGEKHRLNEYAPFEPSESAKKLIYDKTKMDCFTSEGILYIKWIVEELKPYIDSTFRAKTDYKNTMLVGSSMGGLISLFGGLQYNKIFGGLGVLSPAFWYCKEEIIKYVKASKEYEGKVFMSVGTAEEGIARPNDYINGFNEMEKILNEKKINSKMVQVEKGKHHELFWEPLLVEMTDYFLDLK